MYIKIYIPALKLCVHTTYSYIWPTLRRKLKIKFKFRIHLIKVSAVKSADGTGEVMGVVDWGCRGARA